MGGVRRLEIKHTSRYRYNGPVSHSVMRLCLKPLDDARQRLLRFHVETDPPAALSQETDSFGNSKHLLTLHHEHNSLEISSTSAVETAKAPSLPSALPNDAWEEIRSWQNSFRLWDFTHPSAYAHPSDALGTFVEETDLRPGDDPLESVLRLSNTLHRAFQFAPGSTSAVSPIEHILETRQGVCQDYAHVMIAIARSWGVPARYTSGYLYAGSWEEESLSSASHAWVECLLPGLDWVGFDPTNRGLAGQRHVRLAVGRDYKDVTPTEGIIHGNAQSTLEVQVGVRPVDS